MKHIAILILILATCLHMPCTFAVTPKLLHTFDNPTTGSTGSFGNSVAIEGNHVLIGTPHDDTQGDLTGQAHLFDVSTGNKLYTLNAPNPSFRDGFGLAVAIDGNYAIVGTLTNEVHLFDVTNGSWLRLFRDPIPNTGLFGFIADAIAIDGNHVLIGDPTDDTNGIDAGQAYLFDLTSGNLLHTFNDLNPVSKDAFGSSVAIEGNHVLLGAPGDDVNGQRAGQVHLFDLASGNLLQTFNDLTPVPGDSFGNSVAIHGNHVLIGARGDDTQGHNSGQAHLFDTITGDLLHTFDDPTPGEFGQFGHSVAVNDKYALVGSSGGDISRQVHLFDISTGDFLHTFDDPTATPIHDYDSSVALDGDYALIGIQGDNRLAGEAYLYEIVVPEPTTAVLLTGMTLFLAGFHRRN